MIDLLSFEILVTGALILTAFSPLMLISLFIKDWRSGSLW